MPQFGLPNPHSPDSIEQQKRELAEVHQWSSDWELAKQREAAETRLAEKAASPRQPRKRDAETKETLRQLALAQKRLPKSAMNGPHSIKRKRQIRPRLREAQSEWQAADANSTKTSPYQAFLSLTPRILQVSSSSAPSSRPKRQYHHPST